MELTDNVDQPKKAHQKHDIRIYAVFLVSLAVIICVVTSISHLSRISAPFRRVPQLNNAVLLSGNQEDSSTSLVGDVCPDTHSLVAQGAKLDRLQSSLPPQCVSNHSSAQLPSGLLWLPASQSPDGSYGLVVTQTFRDSRLRAPAPFGSAAVSNELSMWSAEPRRKAPSEEPLRVVWDVPVAGCTGFAMGIVLLSFFAEALEASSLLASAGGEAAGAACHCAIHPCLLFAYFFSNSSFFVVVFGCFLFESEAINFVLPFADLDEVWTWR